MNTEQVFRLMCDGRTSINDIVHILRQCGHDNTAIMDAMGAVLDDPDMTGTVNSNFEVVFRLDNS